MTFTLRSKLLLSFAALLVLMGFMAVIIVGQVNAVNTINRQNYTKGLKGIELLGNAIAQALLASQRLEQAIRATTPDEQLRQIETMTYHEARVEELIADFRPLIETDGEQAALEEFEAVWTSYRQAADAAVQLGLAGERTDAETIVLGEAVQALEQSVDWLRLVQDIEDNLARARFEESQTIFQQSGTVALSVTGMALLLGIALAFGLSRAIATPIAQLAQNARQVASGNLEQAVAIDSQRQDEVGVLSRAFNDMTDQLQNLVSGLEARVAARTRRLEIGATLTEKLSAVLDMDQLMIELVEQIRANFGYYHAHVYLLDQQTGQLVIAAGTGEAGQQMKAAGFQISLKHPTNLAARAARTGQIIRVDNVRELPGWQPNPYLPDTYCEMAVPIMLEGKSIGVLDVQEDTIAALDEGDESLLRSLVNQVAVGIRNARLFAEVERQLAEARGLQARYVTQSWQKAGKNQGQRQTLIQRPEATQVDERVLARLDRTVQQQSQPAVVFLHEGTSEHSQSALVVPVRVQERTIGAIQLLETEQPRQWTEQELALVQAVADQVAQTAENLRLFDETRERAGREQTIREITDKLRAAPSLNMLMETAARELGAQLGIRRAVLELGIDAAEGSQTKEGNGYGNQA